MNLKLGGPIPYTTTAILIRVYEPTYTVAVILIRVYEPINPSGFLSSPRFCIVRDGGIVHGRRNPTIELRLCCKQQPGGPMVLVVHLSGQN